MNNMKIINSVFYKKMSQKRVSKGQTRVECQQAWQENYWANPASSHVFLQASSASRRLYISPFRLSTCLLLRPLQQSLDAFAEGSVATEGNVWCTPVGLCAWLADGWFSKVIAIFNCCFSLLISWFKFWCCSQYGLLLYQTSVGSNWQNAGHS